MKREKYTKRGCKNSCNLAKRDIYVINKLKNELFTTIKLCMKICTFKG